MWQYEIAYYRTRFPEYAPVLDIAEAVLREQDALAEEQRSRASPVTVPDLLAAAGRLAAIYPDGPALAAALREALTGDAAAQADPLVWARDLVRGRMPAAVAELDAFVAALLVPYHDGLRLPNIVVPDAPTAVCSACGGPPLMARFRQEDGATVLGCAFCRSEWLYPRTVCPGCGVDDPAAQRFFYVEGDRGHRVNVCDRCGIYIKAADERVMGRAVALPVEDVVTGHLDLLAAEAGYRRIGV